MFYYSGLTVQFVPHSKHGRCMEIKAMCSSGLLRSVSCFVTDVSGPISTSNELTLRSNPEERRSRLMAAKAWDLAYWLSWVRRNTCINTLCVQNAVSMAVLWRIGSQLRALRFPVPCATSTVGQQPPRQRPGQDRTCSVEAILRNALTQGSAIRTGRGSGWSDKTLASSSTSPDSQLTLTLAVCSTLISSHTRRWG